MYLPTSGASRDRTADMMSLRGSSLKNIEPNRETSETSLLLARANLYDEKESPLEPFFQLSSEIKRDISDLNATMDTLLKKHKECLRPTFTDSLDSLGEINALTASMNAKMQNIQLRLGYFTMRNDPTPDRIKILNNMKSMLTELYREFAVKFKLEQQTFSASLNRKDKSKSGRKKQAKDEVDFDSFNFGTEGTEQRILQVQRERNEQEIEQIARRAEEIRNIFMDLHNLIVEQGTVIDRIDFCINETLNNTMIAEEEVKKAAKHQKKSRMWLCAFILGILILILFLMGLSK